MVTLGLILIDKTAWFIIFVKGITISPKTRMGPRKHINLYIVCFLIKTISKKTP